MTKNVDPGGGKPPPTRHPLQLLRVHTDTGRSPDAGRRDHPFRRAEQQWPPDVGAPPADADGFARDSDAPSDDAAADQVPAVLAADRLAATGYHELGERHRQLGRAFGELRQLQLMSVTRQPASQRTGRWRRLEAPEARAVLAELDCAAREEVLRTYTDAAPAPRLGRHRLRRDRLICDRAVLAQPDGDLALRASADDSEVRVGGPLGVSMWIVDREHVLFGPSSREQGSGVYIRSPRVAGALCQLFDLLWEESVPVSRGAPPAHLTQAQWRVLQLLAFGLDDPTLARVTGTTIKTVRSHVAAVLAAVGAPTRFAAGVQVAARGWLV